MEWTQEERIKVTLRMALKLRDTSRNGAIDPFTVFHVSDKILRVLTETPRFLTLNEYSFAEFMEEPADARPE